MTRRRLLALAGALIVAVASGLAVLGQKTPVPVADALRYMTPAMNLARHGVISGDPYRPEGTPHPTLLDGGPLVVFEQAALVTLDPVLARSFACVLTHPPGRDCRIAFMTLKLAHWAETLIFLACLGAMAKLVTGRTDLAWASVLAALPCKEMYKYSGLALTEPVYLATVGLALWGWTRALLAPRAGPACWVATGVATGLAILAKPASTALLPAAALLLVLAVARGRKRGGRAAAMALVMGLCCAATVTPWLARNQAVGGVFAISDPHYLEATLAHRAGYNTMSWRDWAIAWIDWLPDFGDKAAAALFGRAPVERLAWGPTSYYIYGHDTLRAAARAEAKVTGHSATEILRDRYYLDRPVKFVAASAVLLWRGMFIGHYWGLAALFALVGFFAAAGKSWEMSAVAVPAYAVAAFNAALSVSITRYNLQLLVPGAIALGWVVVQAGAWVRTACGNPTFRREA